VDDGSFVARDIFGYLCRPPKPPNQPKFLPDLNRNTGAPMRRV